MIFSFLIKQGSLYNYADDNTLSFCSPDFDKLISTLKVESNQLGIDIDYQLNFDLHISNLCRKTSQQLNILKGLGPFLSKLNKHTIFYTFILSNFNFCPLAWHFCTDKNTNKIEKV